MGSSFWYYYVPYQDPAAALRDLHREVLRTGDFYWSDFHDPESEPKPTTFRELAQDEQAQEEGTHSILDVYRIIGPNEADDFGTVRSLNGEDIETHLGTPRPTRADMERGLLKGSGPLANLGPRWRGFCTTVYSDEGEPSELAFWGYSGD